MYKLRFRMTSLIALIYAYAVLVGTSYAIPETDNVYIDEDETVKLAIIASYHSDYGQVSGIDLRLYADMKRRLVDIFELLSLDERKDHRPRRPINPGV